MKLTFCRSSFILSAASFLAPARKPERSVIIPGRAPDLPGERGDIDIVYWLLQYNVGLNSPVGSAARGLLLLYQLP